MACAVTSTGIEPTGMPVPMQESRFSVAEPAIELTFGSVTGATVESERRDRWSRSSPRTENGHATHRRSSPPLVPKSTTPAVRPHPCAHYFPGFVDSTLSSAAPPVPHPTTRRSPAIAAP